MGGYAAWVWSAFGLTAVVLAANVIAAGRRYRQAISRMRGRMARRARRDETWLPGDSGC
jgi:heme exporter protein D